MHLIVYLLDVPRLHVIDYYAAVQRSDHHVSTVRRNTQTVGSRGTFVQVVVETMSLLESSNIEYSDRVIPIGISKGGKEYFPVETRYFSSGVKRTQEIWSSCAFLISVVSSPERTFQSLIEPSKWALANRFSCKEILMSKHDEKHIIFITELAELSAYILCICLYRVPSHSVQPNENFFPRKPAGKTF